MHLHSIRGLLLGVADRALKLGLCTVLHDSIETVLGNDVTAFEYYWLFVGAADLLPNRTHKHRVVLLLVVYAERKHILLGWLYQQFLVKSKRTLELYS